MSRRKRHTGRRAARQPTGAAGVAALSVILVACGGDGDDPEAARARGEDLFDNHCAECHGPRGTGTTSGPPLVHEVYEPGHHPDESFQRAVAEGVVPHHWDHGAMPPQPDLDRDEVDDIIAYVRALQREAGIIQ